MEQAGAGVVVLLAGRDRAFLDRVAAALAGGHDAVEPVVSTSVAAASEHLADGGVDAVVCSEALCRGDETDAVSFLRHAAARHPGLATVLVTDESFAAAASTALAAGVTAYLPRTDDTAVYERLAERLVDLADRDPRASDYRELFEQATDAIFLHDPDTGEILDANPRACELTGFSRDDLVGGSVEPFTATDSGFDLEDARERITKAATAEPQTFEWKNRRRDGTAFWSEINLRRTTIGGEERVLAIARDITERKRNAMALRRSERRLRQIAEHIDEVIYLASPDMEAVHYLSPGYEDIWGRPVEHVMERPFSFIDGIHEADRATYQERMRAMIDDLTTTGGVDASDVYEYSYRVVRPDETVRWVEANAYPVRDADGEVRSIAGLITDVTAERRREETLESVHEATQRLSEAETEAAASETAVAAAVDVLGFSLVGVFLYDDAAGGLRPAATSAALGARVDRVPTVDPGDRAWQVFVEGDAYHRTDAAAESVFCDGDGLPAELVLPLGSHGLLLVGADSAAGFETDDIEAAQILAARLEAGLNHVEGERELAKRERALEAEASRADRLDRLNSIIRDIEQALIDESTREGVESTVCARLTAAESIGLAWIGAKSFGGDSLTVRNRSGGGDREGAPVDVVIEDATVESHPAWEALEARASRVVNSLVADRTQGAWRTQALNRGYQSCCAVPLTHDRVVHGVLMVYADEPGAFEGRERRVLEELGRSIGYAITTIERRRALESDAGVELELETRDDGVYLVDLARRTGGVVEHERAVRNADGGVSIYCRLSEASESTVEEFTAAQGGPRVRVVNARDDAWLLEVSRRDWFGSLFADFGAVIESARATPESGRLTAALSQELDVRTVVERFREAYPETELAAKRQIEGRTRTLEEVRDLVGRQLTDRQREVLETAYFAGYFEWPREASGVEVAELLGITQPTFNRHLRLAEERAFRVLLDAE